MSIAIGPLRIHKEGKSIIPISIVVIVGLVLLGFYLHPVLGYILTAGGLVLAYLIVHFFRDPIIQIPVSDEHIISPCDGKVVVIEEVEDSAYFQEKVMQISIFMSPLDVHVNRNPISGEVVHYQYFPGKYLMAFNPKSSQLNEQNLVVVKNDQLSVGYKQIAGFMARRIKTYITENQKVDQGEEYGFIRFGSRIDVLLPTECDITVKLGDKVKAGISVIARVN